MRDKWKAEPGAYRCAPYAVIMSGPKWLARFNRPANFPEHLGTFDSHIEAMEACAEHWDEMQTVGWGGK